MRIGFDAKRVFFNQTGLGNYSRALVTGLKKYFPENSYTLFTPAIRGKRAENYRNRFSDFSIVEPKKLFNRMITSRWRSKSIVKDIVENQIELYHGLSHEIPQGLSRSGIKSVVTVHDLIFLKYPEFYNPWDVHTYKKKYLESCRQADVIIAVSENTKKDIIQMLRIPEDKIRVVYQCAESIFYEKPDVLQEKIILSKYKIESPYILYVGSLNKRKNVISLIHAFARIKNKEIKLVIVGNGGEFHHLSTIAEKLQVKEKILFLKNVSNEQLPALYRRAEVFAYPSIYEGFGIPIIESLLCGTPVITNMGSCFQEAGGEGAVYVDVKNPDILAESIDYLCLHSVNKEYSLRGLEYVSKFTLQNLARETMQVYKAIL